MAETDLHVFCAKYSAVSYLNYGPFTSYAPTYDSSFSNISKEDSDLIYTSYGEESSLQGSDRYVQLDRKPTRTLVFTQNVTWGIPGWLLCRCFLFSLHLSKLEDVRVECRQDLNSCVLRIHILYLMVIWTFMPQDTVTNQLKVHNNQGFTQY